MKLMKIGIFKSISILVCAICSTQTNAQQDIRYQRCSIIQMMIEHPMYMFNDEIADVFRKFPVSERFNNHNLGVKVVKFATQEFSDQTNSIKSFIKQSNLDNRAVAKWFCWNKETGKFNMNLIKSRGLYNASTLDREIALLSARGSAILSDAGENLIPNTYLIIHDICYTGKYTNKEAMMEVTGTQHRFDVKITSYIFQLDWNEEYANNFYLNYYQGMHDFVKNAKPCGFSFKARVETDYGESSNIIPQSVLIQRVVYRCLDMNIAKLQRAYPDFRIKALLISDDPIQADIGLKEGVSPDDMYEVLEMIVDEKGIASYKRVGIIKPEKGKIWDNRFMAAEEQAENATLGYTTFTKVSGGDFYAGMLIREL